MKYMKDSIPELSEPAKSSTKKITKSVSNFGIPSGVSTANVANYNMFICEVHHAAHLIKSMNFIYMVALKVHHGVSSPHIYFISHILIFFLAFKKTI
jgi:hypothetical protein